MGLHSINGVFLVLITGITRALTAAIFQNQPRNSSILGDGSASRVICWESPAKDWQKVRGNSSNWGYKNKRIVFMSMYSL